MGQDGKTPVTYVTGPDGNPLTLRDLPPPDLKRWVSRRKAEVVLAVEGGLISLEEASRRYALSIEEFVSWEYELARHGLDGLKVSRPRNQRHDVAHH